jgi:hypothetical protein
MFNKMNTGNTPQYNRYTYFLSNELQSYLVYQLDTQKQQDATKILLTDTLRVEVFQNKSFATNINEYLRLRNTNNWATCEKVTGLRPTENPNVFYGDWLKKDTKGQTTKTLLIFQYSDNKNNLNIDVYNGFYPNHRGILNNILKSY